MQRFSDRQAAPAAKKGSTAVMAGFLTFTKEKPINRVVEVDISDIRPNPHQPRSEFDIADIQSLADSILQNGILQPLTVRRGENRYELIAGERRLRAAKLAGLRAVPCIILDISSRNSAIMALVENIQRQDLSFFDEASAIEKLITYYGMTQEDAAAKLGKAQSTIANKLRLLRLTADEREVIMKYNLTERHARALLRLAAPAERLAVLERVVKQNLNVEKTEAAVEEVIGKKKVQNSYKKRSKVFQNVRIFVNTITKAVETMQAVGIAAESQKIQHEDYIEYRVKIPTTTAAAEASTGGYGIRPYSLFSAYLHVKIQARPYRGVRSYLAVRHSNMRRVGRVSLQRLGIGEGRVQHQVRIRGAGQRLGVDMNLQQAGDLACQPLKPCLDAGLDGGLLGVGHLLQLPKNNMSYHVHKVIKSFISKKLVYLFTFPKFKVQI